MDKALTKEQGERLLRGIADAMNTGVLKLSDAVAIIEICQAACQRESEALDEAYGFTTLKNTMVQ